VLLEAHNASELAQHLGTSISTGSKQTTVLREAGLITSIRADGSVVHARTAMGRALLIGVTSGSSLDGFPYG
jgi:hypothetical protein